MEAGLEDKVTLLFKDYRELQGKYDKLVSIEMIEAIGHQYFDIYFKKSTDLLKSLGYDAIAVDHYCRSALLHRKTFSRLYPALYFPGGWLPSVAALSDAIGRKTDMRIFHREDIGPHYADTLHSWRARWFANIEK